MRDTKHTRDMLATRKANRANTTSARNTRKLRCDRQLPEAESLRAPRGGNDAGLHQRGLDASILLVIEFDLDPDRVLDVNAHLPPTEFFATVLSQVALRSITVHEFG